MEMLSNASKYAINAVLFLALDAHKDRKIGVKEIAAGIDVPVAFLAKLLQNLSRKGVVSSTKGPNGGFYLTEENRLQKLLVVIDHIDGLSKLKECVLGLSSCNSEKPCPMHTLVQPLRKKFLYELSNNSISEFAEKVQKGETFLNY
ncbi:Rrf2 family transcriptional regulator [uncultured Maribacter sp.]|uniref:RrF2 family transcriptional regulator n=1 Tax=uncultured Maribacter sp. TaxID=431308 RepID=UPI0030DA34BB|tara:strand:- start:6 stop:443 length:438 start_codon:yes stop_codon:yes gene_type:complete